MPASITLTSTFRTFNLLAVRGGALLCACACLRAVAIPPTADAGPPQLVPALGTATNATCLLTAARSFDPDGTITAYSWRYRDAVYSTNVALSATLPLGVHPFWLIVTDNGGSAGTDLVVVSVCRGLLNQTFETNVLDDWQATVGAWALDNGTLIQTGDVSEGFIWWTGAGATAWSNYTMSALLTPASSGVVGCAVYCRDASNYYRFGLAGATNLTFSCVTNGVAVPLASALRAFNVTQAHTFIIAATGGLFTVRWNLNNVFNRTVTNSLIACGSVGLIAGDGASGTFDNVIAVVRQRLARVIPVGDSITQGRGTLPYTYSWRYPLHRLCVEDDLPVDMIGSLATGFNGDPPWTNFHGWAFDRNHEGRWGIRPDAVSNQFDGWLKTYSAPGDILLILLGTNGAGDSNAIPRTMESHRRMIEIARRYKPHVVTIIGLPFQEWVPFPAMRTAFRALAADMTRSWSPVVTIDHSPGWISNPDSPGTHTVDWVHPNPTGDFRLAWIWRWPISRWIDHALYTADAPQTPSVLINNGDLITENPTVTVTLAAANPTPDCMQVSTVSNFAGRLWESFTNTYRVILPPPYGMKTVYARFNAGGPNSALAIDTIDYQLPEPLAALAAGLALALLRRRLVGAW